MSYYRLPECWSPWPEYPGQWQRPPGTHLVRTVERLAEEIGIESPVLATEGEAMAVVNMLRRWKRALAPRSSCDVEQLLGVRGSAPTCMNVNEWSEVLRHDPCSYCGLPANGYRQQVDHIVPLRRGTRAPEAQRALDTWSNYTGACGLCNRVMKSDDSLLTCLLNVRELCGLLAQADTEEQAA